MNVVIRCDAMVFGVRLVLPGSHHGEDLVGLLGDADEGGPLGKLLQVGGAHVGAGTAQPCTGHQQERGHRGVRDQSHS